MVEPPIVQLSGACKTYTLAGGQVVRAFDHIDLSVPADAFVIVMGPNGAGKSTLMRALDGSVPLDSGEVLFNHQPAAPGVVRQATLPLSPKR